MNFRDPATISAGAVDPESPWPGLRSFTEETQNYFFGRGDELQDLFERVLHKALCVLFGRSGLGKTSLIQAGLAPRLRQAGLLPVPIRIRYDENVADVGTQMVESLRRALGSVGRADFASADLWLLLHDPVYGLIEADGAPAVRPVFIFDQFEEIFTLGVQQRQTADDFRQTLATLIENRMPEDVRERIGTDEELADRINYRAQPAKVLLSLREDYLYLLERWRREMPSLMENRVELRPLSGVQAVRAIIEPANLRADKPAIVAPETARSIVRFVAGARTDVPLDEIDVVPPLLSLICAELNAQRLACGEETITATQLEGQSDDILERFYSSAFAEHPAPIREFVEERLISEAGYRQAVTLDTAEAELSRAGISHDGVASAINDLVERRLLVVEERNGVRRIELTHDVLTSVALASRMARHEGEAAARLTAEQRQRWRHQRRLAAIVVAALIIGCAALLLYAYRAQQKIKYRELLDRGYVLFQAGDYSGALAPFKKAARLQPSELEPWFGIGDSLVRQTYASGDPRNTPLLSDAIDAYNHTIALEKKSESADYSIGRAKLAEAYVGLGDVYAVAEKPDFDKATALYQKAKDIDPGSPDPAIGYGNIFLGEGKFREAIEQYNAAIAAAVQRNSPSYGAHAGLGSACLALGEYRKAIDEFNRAIGANPGSVIARFRLANAVYLNDKNDPAAVALFQGLLGSSMKRVDALTRTNLAFMMLEKTPDASQTSVPPEAIKYLEEAYQEDRYAFSAFRLGIARALQGNTDDAAKLWDECGQLSWGSDAIERRLYSSFLSALRGEPDGETAFTQSVALLEREGAAGLLEGVRRDAELIRRSKFHEAQLLPIVDQLDTAIRSARAAISRNSH
jgi:tetratricopeptide (TPR) repeat protein